MSKSSIKSKSITISLTPEEYARLEDCCKLGYGELTKLSVAVRDIVLAHVVAKGVKLEKARLAKESRVLKKIQLEVVKTRDASEASLVAGWTEGGDYVFASDLEKS